MRARRLNSPNDLVYRSDGALYFTDPPFGLPKVFDDPRKELPYSGVYCVKDGQVKLVSTDLDAPNGLAFSPDEKFLYVNNWNDKKKVILRYEVQPDCTLTNSRLFFDMTNAPGNDALDGLKVDQQGNVYSTGPGGLWIISPEGKHWVSSRDRKIRTTWPGVTTTARRCTSQRSPGSIASD